MKWLTFKFPYSGIEEVRHCLREMGLQTADTGHGGVAVWHGRGKPQAMIKVASYGRCAVMVADDLVPDFLARCSIVQAEKF